MSIAASDLILYDSANTPTDDTSTSGGAIDATSRPVMTQFTSGAKLSLTSDGVRHRPVHRGVWVSEAIFGRTPPPPPANVDP